MSDPRSVALVPYLTASEVAAVFRWSLRKARRRLREEHRAEPGEEIA